MMSANFLKKLLLLNLRKVIHHSGSSQMKKKNLIYQTAKMKTNFAQICKQLWKKLGQDLISPYEYRWLCIYGEKIDLKS